MRILVGIDTWRLIGGSERYAGALVRALAGRGHRLSILCGETGEPAPAGVGLELEPAYSAQRPTRDDCARLVERVRSARPDVLLLLTVRSQRAFAALAELAPPLPILRWVQDHTPFCPGLNKMHEDGSPCTRPMGLACLEHYFLRRGCVGFKPAHHAGLAPLVGPVGGLWKWLRALRTAARAARLVVASEYMRGELLAAGVGPERIALLPYFTSSASADEPPAELPAPTTAFLEAAAGEPLLFTPARLTLPDKGVDFLLTALGKLARPARAVIAGSGPARDWLIEKARAEGLAERVHFADWLSAGQVESLYGRADVVVCPSVWNEPFGLVGLEAMAHGKPVVAFAVGGIPEWLVDGETGLAVERGDTDGLARAVERVLADPDWARRMGRAGRERAQLHFGLEAHLEALEGLLEQATR